MATDNRPLSPHLQIYRPQWTSVLSISHRITGVALAVGTIYLVWWLAAAARGPANLANFNDFAGGFIPQVFLFGWTFCLFYHLANGIRHLIWDSARMLELEPARKSGMVVVAAAGGLTVLAWIIGLATA